MAAENKSDSSGCWNIRSHKEGGNAFIEKIHRSPLLQEIQKIVLSSTAYVLQITLSFLLYLLHSCFILFYFLFCTSTSPSLSDGVRKKLLGGGDRAVKVPIVSAVRESLQTIPIVLSKKTKGQGHGFYEVPTVHANLGANGELAKVLGELQLPQAPSLVPSLPSFSLGYL